MSTDQTTQGTLWRNADAMAQSAKAREKLFSPPAQKMVQMSGIASAKGPLDVLDNGSGDGIVAQQVWDVVPEEGRKKLHIVCGDLSPAMVQLAAQRIDKAGWPAAKAVVMDMQDMKELADSAFTHCLSGFAVQFAPKHDFAFNGAVHAVFEERGHVREALARVPGCPAFPTEDALHAKLHWGHQWRSEQFVEAKLKEHGFTDIEIEEDVHEHTFPASVVAATGGIMTKPMLALFWEADAVQKFGGDIASALLKYFEAEGMEEVTFTNVALVAVARAPAK